MTAARASSRGAYDRHRFTAAFNAQIAHGIFDYCGAPVKASELLLLPEPGSSEAYLDKAQTLGEMFLAKSPWVGLPHAPWWPCFGAISRP